MKPKKKPKTLKVAQAVENEGASFSKASRGRLDWQWKPEEDAGFAESGSLAYQYSASGNESSEDRKRSSSSPFPSSSTSSSGVEVPLKKKVLPGKGTKRPITTLKQSAKKRCTVKTARRKI